MARNTRTPLLPATAERRYVSDLIRAWRVVEQTIAIGLRPILAAWPNQDRADATAPRIINVHAPVETRSAQARRQMFSRQPGQYRKRPSGDLGIFGPPPRMRRIWELTDDELRELWPTIDPDDIREYAPWATSREQVIRIGFPVGEQPRLFDVEARVKAAIQVERAARATRPRLPDVPILEQTRAPDAFRPRRVPEALRPFVFLSNGMAVVPPQPGLINRVAIDAQMAWIRLVIEDTITAERLSPVLERAADGVDRVTTRELQRIIPIDIRQQEGMRPLINAWREANVNLIESGTRANEMQPRLRPSMLSDISRVVEEAHAGGARVEVLAQELMDRFQISESRAELIARDQILKLNAQIHRQKQQSLGIREYIWRTSKDRRVRPTHRQLHNTSQSWDNPPEVAPGRHEHPGGDYQCRCRARPVLPE